MAMTNDDGGGFVFVNFDTGTVDPVGGESYIVNIGQLDPTEADTLNGCEDWGVYSPEARAIVARHGVRVADLVRPGETGGGGSELVSGGHPEPVRAVRVAEVDPVRLWVRTERVAGGLVETVKDILYAARKTIGDEYDAAQFLAADMVEALGDAVAVFQDLLAEIEAAREVKA